MSSVGHAGFLETEVIEVEFQFGSKMGEDNSAHSV